VIYAVRHLTTYRYDSEVAYARCVLRLTPCTGAAQTLLQSSVTVTPAPALKTIKTDAYGAQVVSMIIDTPHEVLVIESRCVVDVHAGEVGDLAASPAWEILGKKGLGASALPQLGVLIDKGEIGFRQHEYGHTPAPNWPYFIAFADRTLK